MEFDGTNYFVSSGGVRFTMAKTLIGSATLNFPSTPARTSSDLTITVTGATTNDFAIVNPTFSVSGNYNYTAWVSAANTVTVRFHNYTSSSVDPGSGTFRVVVLDY